MTNLAAAVELVDKWCRESSEWKADKRKQLIPSHFDLGRIKALDQCADELKTILAELGTGAGDEPKHVFEIPVDRYDWTEDGMEIIPKNQSGPNEYVKYDDYEKLYNTRPPVTGLAELTDAQLVELFDYIEVARGNAAQKHWASSETMQSWEARRKVVIAKAAREFLGKVDG